MILATAAIAQHVAALVRVRRGGRELCSLPIFHPGGALMPTSLIETWLEGVGTPSGAAHIEHLNSLNLVLIFHFYRVNILFATRVKACRIPPGRASAPSMHAGRGSSACTLVILSCVPDCTFAVKYLGLSKNSGTLAAASA